ncbi:GrpB family protein [Flavobacterium sp. JP2137]|uniref:GrpB family protein n=1 Tax=Flavobacterium sp. JP2137 TaxID=3414510 RepID=UPI003D3001DE
MKLTFEKHNPNWSTDFENIKNELLKLIGNINPKIEHIGSTSIQGLSAKPIIDILIGVNSDKDLEGTISPLISSNYVYYECFNEIMPYRRFFVKHKINPRTLSIPIIIANKDIIPASTEEHNCRLAHIHILHYNSEHWLRHIAFRDYLKTYPLIKEEYQLLKEELSKKEWRDGNEYNEAKNKFIEKEEKKAIDWYLKKR